MGKHYNQMYKKLVKSKSDIKGIVAYSVYKRHKIKYIEECKRKNNGQNISVEELQKYHDVCESNTDSYKSEAEKIVERFIKAIVKKEKSTSFWRGVTQSVIADLIMIVMAMIILWKMGVDVRKLI